MEIAYFPTRKATQPVQVWVDDRITDNQEVLSDNAFEQLAERASRCRIVEVLRVHLDRISKALGDARQPKTMIADGIASKYVRGANHQSRSNMFRARTTHSILCGKTARTTEGVPRCIEMTTSQQQTTDRQSWLQPDTLLTCSVEPVPIHTATLAKPDRGRPVESL